MNLPRLHCPRCGEEVVPRLSRTGPHIRADCPRCSRFLAFVPQTDVWVWLLDKQNAAVGGDMVRVELLRNRSTL